MKKVIISCAMLSALPLASAQFGMMGYESANWPYMWILGIISFVVISFIFSIIFWGVYKLMKIEVIRK